MTDEVRALPAKWREAAKANPSQEPHYCAHLALEDCADELDKALAVSGTLTDEMIEEYAKTWRNRLAGAESIALNAAMWARSQVAVSGAEPTRAQVEALRIHPPAGFDTVLPINARYNEALDAVLAILHRPASSTEPTCSQERPEMSTFKPGDRVLFTKSTWNPTPLGLVCRARISPRTGNPAYDVTWLDASGGWTDNIPEGDLALESRPVYLDAEDVACLQGWLDYGADDKPRLRAIVDCARGAA